MVITNAEDRMGNFHNIHWSGRIISNSATADAYCSGYLVLMCVNQQQFTVPASMTEVILEDMQGYIILAKQWMTYGGLTFMGGMSKYDFDFNLGKISRNCTKEGRLVGRMYNDSGSPQAVVLTQDLSCNLTQG